MNAQSRSLNAIARDIRKDWGSKVNYAARPYLEAMLSLDSIQDSYYSDSGRSIVLYFLTNAGTYRGENAKAFKAELKALAGIK